MPQELGDFGVLVRGGWSRELDVSGGAGNFVCIAASDLIPEIEAQVTLGGAALHFGCFALGLALMWALGGLP